VKAGILYVLMIEKQLNFKYKSPAEHIGGTFSLEIY